MISQEKIEKIQYLASLNLSNREIAKQVDCDKTTVARYINYKDELIGKRINKIVILRRLYDSECPKVGCYYECQCDCGKKMITAKGELNRTGSRQIQSCGRCGKEEEIGKKYGKLTILSKSDVKIRNRICWNCKCDCGKELVIIGTDLRTGRKTSCGNCTNAYNFIDETDNQYGKLKVLSFEGFNKSRQSLWKCQCECGNIKIIRGNDLRRGKTLSCGCSTKSHGEIKIKEILISNNISFIEEKTFNECRFLDTHCLARFDFYLPKYNCCIEYDGRQHFIPSEIWGGKEALIKTKERDSFKTKWCKENNIKLIRIPYIDYNKLNYEYIIEKINKQEG